MMGNGWGNGWAMGGVGMFFMLLFWIALIALIVWAVRGMIHQPPSGPQPPPEDPEAILDRRFAAGEIDVEEYRLARDELAATRAGRRRSR